MRNSTGLKPIIGASRINSFQGCIHGNIYIQNTTNDTIIMNLTIHCRITYRIRTLSSPEQNKYLRSAYSILPNEYHCVLHTTLYIALFIATLPRSFTPRPSRATFLSVPCEAQRFVFSRKIWNMCNDLFSMWRVCVCM